MMTLETRYTTPLVDIYETEQEVRIEADMPGVSKEDIDIQLEGDELIVTAKHSRREVPAEYVILEQERIVADYYRKFSLGSQIEREKINAKYDKGVLTISLGKSEQAKPKKIAIN